MPDSDADFYGWGNEQAGLLRGGRPADADVANIAEEIESMGRSEKRELVNRLAVLLAHMLKWRFEPNFRSRSWQLMIDEQRRRLRSHLADNPSLAAKLAEAMLEGYTLALLAPERETGLEREAFPPDNPWSPAQAMDDGVYPS